MKKKNKKGMEISNGALILIMIFCGIIGLCTGMLLSNFLCI